MQTRKDALVSSAKVIHSVNKICSQYPGTVGTVGKLEVLPGAINVIPSECHFSIELRSEKDELRHKVRSEVLEVLKGLDLEAQSELVYEQSSVYCDDSLMNRFEQAHKDLNKPPFKLPSGAGHDGLAMCELAPIAMLFIPCVGGISHNPAEAIDNAHAFEAAQVLMAFLRLS
jgi:allantoate deiminase